jgi:energy-coupling factor transport system ATP-binding protein
MVQISIEDLSFRYQGNEDLALDNIDLQIQPGEFILITGPSGCGKSTLVDAINGLIPHRYKGFVKGNIYIDGTDWFDLDYTQLSIKIGLVRQDAESQLACTDVKSEVAFGPENLCLSKEEINERVNWALEVTGAKHLKKRLINSLSGGEKQRIAIASMLSMKPEMLILDEPSSFVDIPGIRDLFNSLYNMRISKPKMTLIVVDHELFHVLPIIDRLIIMSDSEIIMDGDPYSLIIKRFNEIEYAGVRIHPSLLEYFKNQSLRFNQKLNENPFQSYFELNKLLFTQLDQYCRKNINRKLNHNPLLKIRNVSFQYKNPKITQENNKVDTKSENNLALKNVNFDIYTGDLICLMGNNGSGKTTLLRLLAGQLEPTNGEIVYKEKNLNSVSKRDYAQEIGIIFQNPEHQFFKRSVEEEVLYGPDNFGLNIDKITDYINRLLKFMNLDQYLERLPFSLSWGQKRRLNIASILSYFPNILFLDEIFIGQDLENVLTILKILKGLNCKLNQTIIICSHKPDIILNLANRVILLDDGKIIIDGSVNENLNKIFNFFYSFDKNSLVDKNV